MQEIYDWQQNSAAAHPLWRPAVSDETTEDARFLFDVLSGLKSARKTLPCKYFYDEAGSVLFDRICETPEYYPTRTEMSLLCTHLDEIAFLAGDKPDVVELGSCNSQKARILLNGLRSPRYYVPVDVSHDHLISSSREMQTDFPTLTVWPLTEDFTTLRALPSPVAQARNVVYFFAGSTIGNFEPDAAKSFLARLRPLAKDCAILIGVDLQKSKLTLEEAYNDEAGYTRDFNLNILKHINRRLGADFKIDQFEHVAFYNDKAHRIEMHLRSTCDQTVHVGVEAIRFRKGETIHTESSYKYTIGGFQDLARRAGYRPARCWVDKDELFSLHFLRATHADSEDFRH